MKKKIALTDEFWMARALDLARRGAGLAHPNPIVGAVIVAGLVRAHASSHSGVHPASISKTASAVGLRIRFLLQTNSSFSFATES